ncbi:hypothetical protein KPH14_005154 [Odynerus spinipes]|uniref:CHK kinase-like domain-containing protein n=1 Tax=Odynerus spinipes TaxID=1348599 RepID=A0AAD9RKK3_9HYME|nr:hypothetical protein KPH14_005154 [Odynerus spinipes]
MVIVVVVMVKRTGGEYPWRPLQVRWRGVDTGHLESENLDSAALFEGRLYNSEEVRWQKVRKWRTETETLASSLDRERSRKKDFLNRKITLRYRGDRIATRDKVNGTRTVYYRIRQEMAVEAPPWLNIDLVENILQKSKKNDSIRVIDIFIKPATAKGDNYTSDMYRVIVEISRRRGDRVVTEKRSFIVKVAPLGKTQKRELVEKTDIFGTEITVMMDTLKKMNDLLGPENLLCGRIFHVQREYPEFLMIEDLATLGFRMADRQSGLDLDHCVIALRALARFHASSVAICEKEPETKQLYQKGMYSHKHPAKMQDFFIQGTKSLVREARKWQELDQKSIESPVVVWLQVDFQLVAYTTPALDLNYFFSTSPNEEVLENKRDLLLEEYLNTLSSTMKQLGCKTSPPTMKELQRDLEETGMIGMISAFAVLPLILVDKNEVRDLDEIMHENNMESSIPGYANLRYRKLITKRIPIYDRLGLLDL